MAYPAMQRILLKLSGESLAGPQRYGIDVPTGQRYAESIARALEQGLQIAVVIGGGNIFRGLEGAGMGFSRPKGDQMGMLATVINSLALAQILESQGVPAKVYTSTPMMPIAKYYHLDDVNQTLEDGHVAILAGGTGNPYFTTDSAAALRAAELQCSALLKGTRVDGVYTADPEKDPAATRYDALTFEEAYQRQLHIMDLTAFTLCRENDIPVIIFDMNQADNLPDIASGKPVGTIITTN